MTAAEHLAALRTVTEGLPVGGTITVTREQLLALFNTEPPTSAPPTAGHLLAVDEVAARLNVGIQYVYRNKKSLGAVKVGRAVRFPSAAVERFIACRSLSRMGSV